MKVKKKGVEPTFHNGVSVSLVILSICLLCGAVAGSVCASYLGGTGGDVLGDYMSRYVTEFGEGTSRVSLLPSVLWNVFRYPLVAFLFGFTLLGVICVPGIAAIRGFFIAFSIGSMIKVFGTPGIWLALSIFGVQTLIGLPCFLMISAQSIISARNFAKMVSGGKRVMVGSVFPRGYFVIFGLCTVLLFVVVLLEIFAVPRLVAFTALRMLQ